MSTRKLIKNKIHELGGTQVVPSTVKYPKIPISLLLYATTLRQSAGNDHMGKSWETNVVQLRSSLCLFEISSHKPLHDGTH